MSTAFWLDLGVGAGALLALALLVNGARHLRRGRLVRGGTNGLGGVVIALIVTVVLLIGINLLTYARFTAEEPVATLRFEKLAPRSYAVTLERAGGGVTRTRLRGDQWQLDARIIKWAGIGILLGLEPLYRLERLSGRYEDVRSARSSPRSVIALAADPGLSLWKIARDQANWLPLVDATYGTATFLPMADGAAYHVSLSTTGLLARPANEAAARAVRHWQ